MSTKYKKNGLAKVCPECKHRLTGIDYTLMYFAFGTTKRLVCPHCKYWFNKGVDNES